MTQKFDKRKYNEFLNELTSQNEFRRYMFVIGFKLNLFDLEMHK